MPRRSQQQTDELCPVCWPDGWPEGGHAAGCEHGEWTRPEPDADSGDGE